MIAQQHEVLVAEVFLQARPLVVIERDALIVVIGEVAGDELRGLIERQQAFHATRDRGAVRRMQMHHAAGILAHFMDRGMNGEAGRVDLVIAFGELVAVEVDLDEARRGDLVEHQAVRIDQEVMLGAGHARRDMGVNQIVPAVQGDEAIGSGEIDPLRPFGLAHMRGNFLEACFGWRHRRLLRASLVVGAKRKTAARAPQQRIVASGEWQSVKNLCGYGAGIDSRLAMLSPRMS